MYLTLCKYKKLKNIYQIIYLVKEIKKKWDIKLIEEKIDNAVKKKIIIRQKMILKITYTKRNLNIKIYIIESKHEIILIINFY